MKMVLPVDGYRSATDFMEAMQGTASDAYWLLKPGEFWHGGVHLYENFASNAVYRPESHGLKCMTDGHAVAWRLNDNYQTATYDNNLLKFSSTFVLIKSTCVPDEDKSANALEFYTLWMQIAPLSEYGTDTPTATVTASSLKVRQDNPAQGWVRTGLPVGNVPNASHCYEAPLDTHTTLPKDIVVEIEEEATFLLNGQPAPFMFVRVKSVPDGKVSGLSAGESGWISGLDTYVKRKASNLPDWMQKAREHGVFNQVVSGKSIEVKAGDLIGHLSYHERPETAPQHFCHLEVFSQDQRMEDFLANKAGVTKGAAQLHALANKTLWKYIADTETFVAAEVGGAPSLSTAERFTSESDCQNKISDGKTWYEIPAESAWMSADDVGKVNQFDLEKRGFIRLEQNEEPQSIFQTPREGWLRQTFGRLEELTRSESSDTYTSGDAEGYQKLLQEMDTNQDGLIDVNELWRYLHNNQRHIQYQVQRLVVKHHSEWLKDGMTTLWQTALNEQAGSYPELALYNYEYINKLVWMKDVQEIRSSEALWHMHPVVFLSSIKSDRRRRDYNLGSLSSRYETGGRGSLTVSGGQGDAGGVSYGSYQMTSQVKITVRGTERIIIGGTVKKFVNDDSFIWRNEFSDFTPGSTDFTSKWRAVVTREGEAFKTIEHEFIRKTHFDKLVNHTLEEVEVDVRYHSHTLNDVVWSTSVQHGPENNVIINAINSLGGAASETREYDRDLIIAIYDERGKKRPDGNLVYFSRNSPGVQAGVVTRFINEKNDALGRLSNEVDY